jgi:hypothetical protein
MAWDKMKSEYERILAMLLASGLPRAQAEAIAAQRANALGETYLDPSSRWGSIVDAAKNWVKINASAFKTAADLNAAMAQQFGLGPQEAQQITAAVAQEGAVGPAANIVPKKVPAYSKTGPLPGDIVGDVEGAYDPTGIFAFRDYAKENPIQRWDVYGPPMDSEQPYGNELALERMRAGTMGTQGWDSIQPAEPGLQEQTDDLMAELLANIKRQGQFHYGQDQTPEQAVDMLTQLQNMSGGMTERDAAQQMMDFRQQMLGGGDGPMTSDRVAQYQMMNTGQAPYWYGENIANRENMARTISQVEDKIRRIDDQLALGSTRKNPQLIASLEAEKRKLQEYINMLQSGVMPGRGGGMTTTGFASPTGGGTGNKFHLPGVV